MNIHPIVLFSAMFFALFIGLFLGDRLGQDFIQSQALKRGFATWEIVNPETGETEFRWKEAP